MFKFPISRQASTSTRDGSRSFLRQIHPPATQSRSAISLTATVSTDGRGAVPSEDGRFSATSQRRNSQSINIILFGEMGAGKSAVINLIAQPECQVAKPLSHITNGSLLQSTRHDIAFDGLSFSIFDTLVLEEPTIGVSGYLTALENAYELVRELHTAGGVHLLLFVLEANRITETTRRNHRLFFETIFQTKVPLAFIWTSLPEEEVEMEEWWRKNKTNIEREGLTGVGHACITAVDTPKDPKYMEVQKEIRDLLKGTCLQVPAFCPDLDAWFAFIGAKMQDFIKNGQRPERKALTNVLLKKRLKLDPKKVPQLLDMIERGNIQLGMADTPEERAIKKLEALIAACDLTGHVKSSGSNPFASGSFGDIYKGYFNKGGKSIEVAIKTHKLYVEAEKSKSDILKEFRRELTVWLDLEHPNILPLFGTVRDIGTNPYLPAMVCPWIENGTLTAYLRRNENLTIPQRLVLVNDVARGLQYLHSRGIVHGDLSGSNVLVQTNGRACIADFGLSILLTRLEGSTFAMSRQNKGTVRWAAPELFRFDESIAIPSTRSDVYSFGSVMLQILTGDIPYHYIQHETQVILAIGTGRMHKRPSRTEVTSDRWDLMEWCWTPVDVARLRPTSDQIVEFTERDLAAVM